VGQVLRDQWFIEPELVLHRGNDLFEVGRSKAARACELGKALADGAPRGETRNEEGDGRRRPDDKDEEQDAPGDQSKSMQPAFSDTQGPREEARTPRASLATLLYLAGLRLVTTNMPV